MNCPRHIKEINDPEALAKTRDHEETEELVELLAGREEDYLS